eukprot:366216-Chlamydomonas_euryale.AAC.10
MGEKGRRRPVKRWQRRGRGGGAGRCHRARIRHAQRGHHGSGACALLSGRAGQRKGGDGRELVREKAGRPTPGHLANTQAVRPTPPWRCLHPRSDANNEEVRPTPPWRCLHPRGDANNEEVRPTPHCYEASNPQVKPGSHPDVKRGSHPDVKTGSVKRGSHADVKPGRYHVGGL